MTQKKVLSVAITDTHCSIVGEMSTNSSKVHLGSISDEQRCSL